ncbi:MAG: butanol dehydrogenase [Gammaproteobacteria bacterium]|nr:MAG: butanol dehydrogenase [Gammaproteobacteria bacterium]
MLILALLFVGIIIWGAFNTALEATNTEQFCISCHEMRQNMYDSYLASPHYNNASGVSASCPDCHVPREWTRKVIRKISATNELYHHFTGSIDRPEKFRRKQLQLAKDIWQTMARSDSRECRNCHNRKRMALTNQSEKAALFHSYAEEKNRTCIHCHKGITHPLPQGYQDKGLEEDMKILHKRFEQQKVECHICHKGMAHSDW